MVDSFNISMSQLVPGDIVELKMKGRARTATVHVGEKSWGSCIVSPKGRSYPDTLWGIVAVMESQVGTGKAFKELFESEEVPTDNHGELFTGDFVNDSSKSLDEVMPGDGKMEEKYAGAAESEVAGNYGLDTLGTEDGYVADVDAETPELEVDVKTSDSVLDLLDNSVTTITQHLSDLSSEDLTTIKDAEESGKTRKSLMKAIKAEEGRRTEGASA
jgi:hypothetical protein